MGGGDRFFDRCALSDDFFILKSFFSSIVEPVRNLGFQKPHNFHLAEALNCNFDNQTITVQSSIDKDIIWDIPYDKLVIGVGALSNTFNVPGVEENAFFLKVNLYNPHF